MMKKVIALLLATIMTIACFAITAGAEETNYALSATYTVESSSGENIYGLANGRGEDANHTKLNDGYTGYDECTGINNAYFNGEATDENKVVVETQNTSVCYTGTAAVITMLWDLGEVKTDIAKIAFLNTKSQFEWAADNQFEDYLDGIYDAWSRSFPIDNIMIDIAGEDGEFVSQSSESWTYEVKGLDNPYTDAVESELVDCQVRNVYMIFAEELSARYIKITLSPKRYVLALDEVQILAAGTETTASEAVDTSAAGDASEATDASGASDASGATDATDATGTDASGNVTDTTGDASANATDSTNAGATDVTESAAPSATKAADNTPKTGDAGMFFIFAIAAISLAGVVVFKKVRD